MDTEMLRLADEIRRYADKLPSFHVMEVCGTHTQNIARFGIRQLLPSHMHLLSGPGCPVCVTEDEILRKAVFLAESDLATVVSFGDMLRVPCVTDAEYHRESLYHLKGLGRDVRMGTSPMDVLKMAKEEPDREFVWLGVGFETTTAHTAALIRRAAQEGIRNISVLCAHKTMPNVIRTVLSEESDIQGMLCPGHVAVISGARDFAFIPKDYRIPAAICGFTAPEILKACLSLVKMLWEGKPDLVNDYPSVVTQEGNLLAKEVISSVFEPCDVSWRGLGRIPESGLKIRDVYERFDAEKRYAFPEASESFQVPGCLCAQILRGKKAPKECGHFGKTCTPADPLGPCMVSDEGVCHTEYTYGVECHG